MVLKALNGQNVYNGCCALHIDFSKLKRLSVRYNNDKSRDFTNPHLGSDDRRGNAADPGAGIWGPYPGHGFNMDSGNSVFGFYPGSGIVQLFISSSFLNNIIHNCTTFFGHYTIQFNVCSLASPVKSCMMLLERFYCLRSLFEDR